MPAANIIGLTTDDFLGFMFALRVGAKDVAVELRGNLRDAAQEIASAARSNASQYSSKIPPSIRVRLLGTTLTVQAGAGQPLAALFELGNAGSSGAATFRHPVFGNMATWVDQPTHPFLKPALDEHLKAVEEAAQRALDHAVEAAVTLR